MANERWGIEALWTYNGLVLNDKLAPNAYIVKGVNGLRAPTIREMREDSAGEDGQNVIGDTLLGGKTITLRGYLRAEDFDELRVLEDDLYTALLSRVELPLKISAHPSYPKPITAVQIDAKCAILPDIEDSQNNLKYERDFQVVFTASKPHIVSQAEKFASATVAPGNTFVDVVCNNAGKYPAHTKIRITGPTNADPTVKRTNGADPQTFSVIGAWGAGQWLEFDSKTKTIYDIVSMQRDSYQSLSDWITLLPGNNTIRFTAQAGAQIAITWRDTWV